jgi:hypothetical protein
LEIAKGDTCLSRDRDSAHWKKGEKEKGKNPKKNADACLFKAVEALTENGENQMAKKKKKKKKKKKLGGAQARTRISAELRPRAKGAPLEETGPEGSVLIKLHHH